MSSHRLTAKSLHTVQCCSCSCAQECGWEIGKRTATDGTLANTLQRAHTACRTAHVTPSLQRPSSGVFEHPFFAEHVSIVQSTCANILIRKLYSICGRKRNPDLTLQLQCKKQAQMQSKCTDMRQVQAHLSLECSTTKTAGSDKCCLMHAGTHLIVTFGVVWCDLAALCLAAGISRARNL